MDEAAVETLIKTKPELTPLKTKLSALKKGSYCLHRNWGVGQITGYDAASGKVTIQFEGQKAPSVMDPAFCATKLDLLSDKHIISRHRKNPAEIQGLIDSAPAELLAQILQQAPNQTMSLLEMELTLTYLMGPDFKKWLTNAKKRLAKDQRIALPEKKTESYVLRNEPVAADDEILVSFYKTKNVKKKIELAESLLSRQPLADEVKSKLSQLVEELSLALNDSRVLTHGEKLQGSWVLADLATLASLDATKYQEKTKELLQSAYSLDELADQLPQAYLRRYLELIKASHPDDWQKNSFDLLKNSVGKFTQECIGFLTDNGCSQKLGETLDKWLQEQSLKAPLLMWIIKNRTARRYSSMLDRLITPKLFSAIFYAIDYEAIQNASQKRIALVETLVDDKELIPELLATATPEVASDLAHTLLMNQGFETLTKRSLIARFIKQFPEIQALIDSGDQNSEKEVLVVSWESLEKRKEEYQVLVTKKIPENKLAIAAARELGDLKENSEYKMSRQDQDTLMAMKAQMETELRTARGTDFTECPTDQVGIGSVVEVDSKGQKTTYTILGAWDGNPDKNILSYKTPIAQSLMGKKAGETVKAGGNELKIVSFWRLADRK